MVQTLVGIKDELRKQLGRGAALDAELFGFVKKAVRHIERKASFLYMQSILETELDPEAEFPRTLRITNNFVKSIDFLRLVKEGSYAYLTAYKDARQMPVPRTAEPTGYILVQHNLLYLDHTPDALYSVELMWRAYTDLASSDATEHWLFDNFEDGLLHFAMSYACKHTRDFDRAEREFALGTRVLDDLQVANEEADLLNSEVVMEPFAHEY
jgi:hypothetical protein